MAVARRALLLGLTNADWSLLRPLLDSGRLPSLSALIERGVSGSIRTLQPQFEPLLWTSAASGRRATAHGVVGCRDTVDPENPRPLSSLTRKAHCLWHHAAVHERRSLVINWPVTFPAEPIRGVCLSDLFFRLAGTPEALEVPPSSSLSPASAREDLVDTRISPSRLSLEELKFFIESPAPDDPLLAPLTVALAEQLSVHAATLALLDREAWDLAMVRYDLLATLGPRFMACHPPQLTWVEDSIFNRYRKVMTNAAIYLDYLLGHVLLRLGDDDLVVVFSERGLLADEQRPVSARVAARAEGAPWFRDRGILVMAGPELDADGGLFGAGLLDLAPTVLHGLGLPLPQGIEGRVLMEALSLTEQPRAASMPAPPLSECGGHPPGRQLSEEEADLLARRWREIGLDRSPPDDPTADREAQYHNRFALAAVHIDAGRPDRALPLLDSLYRHRPDDDRIMLHLARCRQATGDLPGARELLEQVVDHPDIRPHELMELARLHLASEQPDHALACLFRAEQAEGEKAPVHCRIGQVYLQMERWEEAERAFTKALDRDPDHANSHLGLARTRLGQERAETAVEAALRSIELNSERPAGHFWLGVALVEAGQPEDAVGVFETLLRQYPNDRETLKKMIDVLDALGRDADAYRQRLHRVEMVEQLEQSGREFLRSVRR